MDRVDSLAEQVRGTLASLTDIPLLLVLVLAHFRSLHIRTVAQLPLFVLVVSIICRIWPLSEMVVVAKYVVVWRGRCGEPNVLILTRHAARDSEPLRPHLRRVETRAEAKLARSATYHSVVLPLHPLIDLLLSVDGELSVVAALGDDLGALTGGRLPRPLISLPLIVDLGWVRHWHVVTLQEGLPLVVLVCSRLCDHDI